MSAYRKHKERDCLKLLGKTLNFKIMPLIQKLKSRRENKMIVIIIYKHTMVIIYRDEELSYVRSNIKSSMRKKAATAIDLHYYLIRKGHSSNPEENYSIIIGMMKNSDIEQIFDIHEQFLESKGLVHRSV